MADGFNPYREWLGLGASALNYYELLALPLHESDKGTITLAAERAMTRVRSFRPGPQASDWARLLDEIRAAKECLIDADRRARYDAELNAATSSEPILPPGCSPSESEAAATPSRAANASSDLYPPTPSRSTVPAAMPIFPEAATPVSSEAETPILPEANGSASWSAGPSPIYGLLGEGQIPSAPIPAAAPIPMPTMLDALPMAMPVSQQPVMPTTYGGPQRATFRAATTVAQKNHSRASGRGIAWGTTTAVVLLGLVAAGLTYRLNMIARQRELVEAAAAAEAAKGAASAPSVTKRRSSRTAKEGNDEAAATPAAEPQANQSAAESLSTTNERESVGSAPVTAVAPDLQDPPNASAATPPNDSTPVAKATRSQVEQLIKSLEAAKAAMVLQDFKAADSQLAKAASLAQLPSHRAAVLRLKQIGEHVKKFRQALAASVADMHAAETFQIGPTQVSFVEGKPDAVILRTGGKNETYRFNDMPPGLALALADRKLAANDSASRVVKGAYLLVNKRADSQTRAKAETLWSEAQAAGASIEHLLPYLTDDYTALLNDAAE